MNSWNRLPTIRRLRKVNASKAKMRGGRQVDGTTGTGERNSLPSDLCFSSRAIGPSCFHPGTGCVACGRVLRLWCGTCADEQPRYVQADSKAGASSWGDPLLLVGFKRKLKEIPSLDHPFGGGS